MNRVVDLFKSSYQYLSGLVVEKVLNPVNYNGVLIDANFGSIGTEYKARFNPLYVLNSHSINEKRLIDRNLPSTLPVIELGGGIGYISCYINNNTDGRKQVVVEPNPENINHNKNTRELNNSEYTLLEGAYHPNDKKSMFKFDSKFSSGGTFTAAGGSELTVDGYSLESICANHDLERFVLVCDIEGGEYPLLDHELELLQQKADLIVMEFHSVDGYNKQEYKARLEEGGFRKRDGTEKATVYDNISTGEN